MLSSLFAPWRRSIVIAITLILAASIGPLLPPGLGARANVFTPNVFGQLQSAYLDGDDVQPASIASIDVYEIPAPAPGTMPATLQRTLIISSTNPALDDSISIDDTTFVTEIEFRQGYTYDMVVVPSSSAQGAETTFRLPGPAGSANVRMAFRLEDQRNPGLLFKTREWACRALSEVNCVESFRVRTTAGPGPWVTVDDTNHFSTYTCDVQSNPDCGVNPGGQTPGDYNWGRYQPWEIRTTNTDDTEQDVRVQFVYRPVDEGSPNPEQDPNPYITLEVYSQSDDFERDGWGCRTPANNDTWWEDDTWGEPQYAYPIWFNDVNSTSGCGGGGRIADDLDYEITLRTARDTMTPMFTAGYLTGMETALIYNQASESYSMTISGAPREWQWIGGNSNRDDSTIPTDDSYSYSNYYDATNHDWSFSTFDFGTVAGQSGDPTVLEDCKGAGMAAMSSNGNGGSMPQWDPWTQTLEYGTQGKHYMPANIDDSGSPTALSSAGLVYIGKAEMVIPSALARCMWADAGLSTQAALEKLAGRVLAPGGDQEGPTLKQGATIDVTVDDTAVYVDASGYTYSAADLVVAPAVGLSPSYRDFGPITVGDADFRIVNISNNTDDSFSISTLTITGADSGAFSVAENGCPNDLAPLNTCYLVVGFSPPVAGGSEASLSMSTTPSLAGPYEVPLWGYAEAAPVTPSPVLAGAPTGAVASAGDASASVRWSAPVDTGSFAITSYEVTSRPGGKTCLTAAKECVVQGLTNGTSYTFTVRALTGAGWGETSAASNAVVPRGDVPPPVNKSILITGSREGRVVSVIGQSTGLADASVTPFVRLRGATTFTQGAGTRPVNMNGAFNWQRSTGKRLSVYFTGSGAKSNTVTIEGR